MRLAFVSDIHGNLPALEAVVADLRRRGVDHVINLGDNLSGPLLPRETAQYLMASGWTHLAGNHDRQLLTQPPEEQGPSDAYAHSQLGPAEFAWLRSLPGTLQWSDEVFLCHGTPADDLQYFPETVAHGSVRLATPQEITERLGVRTAPLVACGHTHVPRAVRAPGGTLIVNPGSAGVPAYEDDEYDPHVVETGSPDARYAIAEKTAAGWRAALLSVPYDFEPMARLAEARGRLEWARALRTGYVR